MASACALLAALSSALIDLDVFTSHTDGYYCFRLPNLVQLKTKGHLLAFAQGKPGHGCPDSGWMDSLVRRSFDNGVTWTNASLVHQNDEHQTMGTPTAIVDETTDTVFIFMNPQHGGADAYEGRRVLLLNSTDGGRSWSAPRDMTSALVPDGWDNVWMGTQQGINVDLGGGRTRLIMCANHHGTPSSGAHTVFSDDHGATWHNGATLSQPAGIGECGLAQTAAGVTMYGRVVYDDPTVLASRRMLAFSRDHGVSFEPGDTAAFPGNPGADAEGAFLYDHTHGTFLVGSAWGQVSPRNPSRHNYTVLVSEAVDGRPSTWRKLPGADPLSPGVEAEYSTMMVPRADPSTFFVMYERGDLYGGGVGPSSSLRLTQLALPDTTG